MNKEQQVILMQFFAGLADAFRRDPEGLQDYVGTTAYDQGMSAGKDLKKDWNKSPGISVGDVIDVTLRELGILKE